MDCDVFNSACKVMAVIGTGTAAADDPVTNERIEAGYLLIVHEALQVPLACMLSIEMLDGIMKGLTAIRDDVTFSSKIVEVSDERTVN